MGPTSGNTITLNEIQRDWITKIENANRKISQDVVSNPSFNPTSLVDDIYNSILAYNHMGP